MSKLLSTLTPFIIAIDGPAASGKGTLAKLIAKHYNIAHLDTGLTYRAVAAKMLNNNLDLRDKSLAAQTAAEIDIDNLDAKELLAESLAEASSKIAVFPEVRTILVEKQREFGYKHRRAVLDGRDVGSVIFPHANIKFFVQADLQERSKRRYQQQALSKKCRSYEEILAALTKRDERDSHRAIGALAKTSDAYLLDTTKKSISESLEAAIAVIDKHAFLL